MKALELKRKIHERKEVVVGMWCGLTSNTAIEMAGKAKLIDFAIFDLEHGPHYADAIVEYVHACEWADVVPLVRVPDKNPILIQKVLDAGAKGIFVPMIHNAEDLREAIAATKYQPEGTRGAMPGCHGADYSDFNDRVAWAKKVKEINDEMIVFTLPLETRESITKLDEIISSPNLDCASVSTMDLTHALGHIDQPNHPEIVAAQDKLIEVAKKHNMPLYCVPSAAGHFEKWYGKGLRVFTVIDREVFLHGFREFQKPWANLRKV
jgi:2-keto-3-deoxy-L-rhamnonate aldolase RhmA